MVAIHSRTIAGKFSKQTNLTSQQQQFVDCFIANGGNAKKAAEQAGYQHPSSEGWRLTNTPSVADSIKRATLGMALSGGTVGMQTLLTVAQDGKVPAAARVNAAMGLCRIAGLLGDDGVSGIHENGYEERNAGKNLRLMLENLRAANTQPVGNR